MTIDESEIRRLAHEYVITRCLNDGTHTLTCDDCSAAIRTALAAERAQHARDVADAWTAAAKAAAGLSEDINSGKLKPAAFDERGDGAGPPGEREGYLLWRGSVCGAREVWSALEARAQALNDSRPPSGINQGSGAGESFERCAHALELSGFPKAARKVREWASIEGTWPAAPPPSPASPEDKCDHGHTYEDCCWRGTAPSSASPTGETRDDGNKEAGK